MIDYDCRTCGACCAPHRPPGNIPYPMKRGYVDLYEEDVDRLPAKRRLQVVTYGTIRGFPDGQRLATKESGGRHVCAMLDGDIGKAVSCSIYEHRPSICQAFERGSYACQDARAEAGLGRGTARR